MITRKTLPDIKVAIVAPTCKKAARAEKFLRKPELTNLISAQAAEMTGDRVKAEAVYKQLLTNEEMHRL